MYGRRRHGQDASPRLRGGLVTNGIRSLVVITVGVFALAGCGSSHSGASTGSVTTIKVGYFPQVHDAALVNIQKFLPSDIKVDFTKFLRYTDAQVALGQGALQFSSMGYTNMVLGAAGATSSNMLAIGGLGKGGVTLVCRKGVSVTGWQGLDGLKVGQLAGGVGELFLRSALAEHGVKLQSINFVNFTAPGPPMEVALSSHAIDCMGTYEPFAATAVVHGVAYYPPTPLAQNAFQGVNNVLAVSASYAAKHANVVHTVAKALQESTAMLSSNKAAWVSVASERLAIPANVASLAMNQTSLDSALYPEDAVEISKLLVQFGIAKTVPSASAIRSKFDTQ